MGNLLILPPTDVQTLGASRGTGSANLLSTDPQEVWLDNAVGTPAVIDLDFGLAMVIDTVFLGCIASAADTATWSISGGLGGYDDVVLKNGSELRVPDTIGRRSFVTHAFWHGTPAIVRFLRIRLTQPVGAAPLSIGVLMAGQAFVPQYNQEWGSGRGVKDTGVMTRLQSGGFALVEGARYGTFKWTFGDLTSQEVDDLYELLLGRGETMRILVAEDPEPTAGLRNRLHYGTFTGLRPYERRNVKQTRWEFTMEDLVVQTGNASGTTVIPYRYWGTSSAAALDSDGVLNLGNSELSASRAKSFSVSGGTTPGRFAYFCYPAREGEPESYRVFGWEEAPVRSVIAVTVLGQTMDYITLRTMNKLIGTINVDVA